MSRSNREILGICEGAKEDKSGWSNFLRHLVDRGLSGVKLIISDACRGLVESIADYLPDAQWQVAGSQFKCNTDFVSERLDWRSVSEAFSWC